MNLFTKKGNIQLVGCLSIENNNFNNNQVYQLISNNIAWKSFVIYNKGDICYRYSQNASNGDFYSSLIDNNKNFDPSASESSTKWNKINLPVDTDKCVAFKIPNIPENKNYIFSVQFSNVLDFSAIYKITTNSVGQQQTFFYISDETKFQKLTVKYFSNYDSGKVLIVDLNKNSVPNGYIYFRYYFQYDDQKTNYFFGISNGSIYGSFSSGSSAIYVRQDNLLGDGSQLNPLRLNSSLTGIDSITGENLVISGGTNQSPIKINSIDITFNNHNLNTANGLVKLNQNGKIPSDLYFSSSDIPEKTSVPTYCYGNPLVIYKVDAGSQFVGNDNNVLLLIQGNTKENTAIGKSGVVFSEDTFSCSYDQFFIGGISSSIQSSKLSSNSFQFDIEISCSSLTQTYNSLFQHYNQEGSLLTLRINNSNITYATVKSVPFVKKQILKFTLRYEFVSNQNYLISLYQQNNKLLQTTSSKKPFNQNSENSFCFLKNYFGQYSGYSGQWRLLRFSSKSKYDLDKKLGQHYKSEGSLSTDSIRVDYNWQQSTQIDNCVIFGKVKNKPCVFPYPSKIDYKLPCATSNSLGGIIVGGGLVVDSNGVLSASVNGQRLDLTNYQQTNYISISSSNSLTLKGGNILNSDSVFGKLFLGSNNQNQQYVGIYWKLSNQSITISNNNLMLSYGESTKIKLFDSYIELNADELKLNGNNTNTANGLVKLNENGLIPDHLISGGTTYLKNSINIYDHDQIIQVNGIKAGNRVNIEIDSENNIAIINADQQGVFRDNIYITQEQLSSSGIFIVKNSTLGSFSISDFNGNLVIPAQRQVGTDVSVDFYGWNFAGGKYTIRFVRGQVGQNANQDLALKMALCL